MADRPFALHITWTCYGTWLPGDQRGYVSNTVLPQGGFYRKHNTPGSPYLRDDLHARVRARSEQQHPTVRMTVDQAQCAAKVLVEAAKAREWNIIRGALMATHVHVLVMDCPPDGPAVRRVLKGVSATELRKQFPGTSRWWTAGGSDRYKNDWASIEAAVHYIATQQCMLVAIVNMEAQVAV